MCMFIHHVCCMHSMCTCVCDSVVLPLQRDSSVLHSSVSYGHVQLSQYLIEQHHMDINLQDHVSLVLLSL